MSDDKTWDNVQALLEYSGVLKLGGNAAGWWAWFGEVGRGGTYFRAYPTLAETVGLMPAPKTPPERDSKGEAELAAIVAERDQLRAALAAANVRAEEAEAQLAAVPVGALWRLYNDYPYQQLSILPPGAVFEAAFNEIFEWLRTQPEVQP